MTAGPPTLRPSLRFGEFEFTPGLRRLERGGVVLELSSRAIEILAVLTERPGEVIAKRELLERVWPDAVVVDAALRVHMAALRRALGDGEGGGKFIVTAPSRGYSFIGKLEASPDRAEASAASSRDTPPRPLPVRPSKVVGREAVVDDLLRQLELQRFVTVVGPGGIGKTTVALLAAHDWLAAHGGAAVFIDLGDIPFDSPESVAEAVCATLGITPQGLGALECLLADLRTREALVVFDTCEGVIETAARLAESLVASAPRVRVLATSREALRAEGETVYRIETLAVPAAGAAMTAQDALTYSAVQLFVQRVAANDAGFEFADADAPIVGAICRELDGLPLAIELAAGRVDAFGIRQVADLLATEFGLNWPGRRTAAPRQQTLNATLNWSHELLGPVERAVFRRLSVVIGRFPLEAAVVVGADDAGLAPADVLDALSSLVAKSLVCTMKYGSQNRYRLLDITRAYARGKLAASGEENEVRQRQAHYYREGLRRAAASEDFALTSEQAASLRATLSWAFAAEGMDVLAIELSAAAASLWLREGLLADSRKWSREALARLDRGIKVDAELDARIALGSSLMYTQSLTAESHRNWEIIYRQAQFDGRNDLRLGGLAVLWGHQIGQAHFGAAQRLLDDSDFLSAVKRDATVAAAFHWMAATTAHFRGDHGAARAHAARILDDLTEAARRLMRRLVGYDLELGALRLLSLSHFFLGDLDVAFTLSARALERATAHGYVAVLSNTLFWEAFVAYQFEEAEEVDRLTTSIIESERPNARQPTVAWAIALQGLSLVRQGELDRGREMVSRGLAICQETDTRILDAFIRAELALQLARRGPLNEAEASLNLVDESDEETWCSPEVLRIRGAVAELSDDPEGAEARYLDALTIGERQGALVWRLRAAISLASLLLSQGRAAEAEAILAPVYAQFTTGREWPDLRRAADCLAACRRAWAALAGRQSEIAGDAELDGLLERTGAPSRRERPGEARRGKAIQ